MRLGRILRGAAVASLAVAAWVAVSDPATAQSSKARKGAEGSNPSKASNPKERASGVIIKVEPVKNSDSTSKTTHRLTINTDAVWRDWARDQSQTRDTGSTKKDAAKGQNSVATAGEPVDASSVVVVDIGPGTRVETRFRASDDETGKGSKTPESAGGSKSEKPVRFRAEDLKPGLFVEVDFRHVTPQNPVTVLSVIRPIGGPDSGSADKAK